MSVRPPSLDLLRGFEAAARLGSFTRAAARLFISQPAVTGHVKALEEQYREQYRAMEQALQTFASTGPHPRDYYVQGEQAYTVASAKYHSRIARLVDIRDEIETDYQNFLEANPEKP